MLTALYSCRMSTAVFVLDNTVIVERSSGLSLNCFSNFTSGLHKNDPRFIIANKYVSVVCNVYINCSCSHISLDE